MLEIDVYQDGLQRDSLFDSCDSPSNQEPIRSVAPGESLGSSHKTLIRSRIFRSCDSVSELSAEPSRVSAFQACLRPGSPAASLFSAHCRCLPTVSLFEAGVVSQAPIYDLSGCRPDCSRCICSADLFRVESRKSVGRQFLLYPCSSCEEPVSSNQIGLR